MARLSVPKKMEFSTSDQRKKRINQKMVDIITPFKLFFNIPSLEPINRTKSRVFPATRKKSKISSIYPLPRMIPFIMNMISMNNGN